MKNSAFVSLLLLVTCFFSYLPGASAKQFQSSEEMVPLIELYTSEGCSSCPPADRWLSSLREGEGLWSNYIPVAFHVDYWDYIGWKDPYARKQFSQRQRRYASEFREPTVYTPGVRKAGREWRGWRRGANPGLGTSAKVGVLGLHVGRDGKFTAYFEGEIIQREHPIQLTVAVLGQGLSSKVTKGENRGKLLKHDFVVLGISTISENVTTGKSASWSGVLPDARGSAETYAVAAWVTEGGSLAPIQAVGGKLEG